MKTQEQKEIKELEKTIRYLRDERKREMKSIHKYWDESNRHFNWVCAELWNKLDNDADKKRLMATVSLFAKCLMGMKVRWTYQEPEEPNKVEEGDA
jgi:hypothetical protein